MKLNTLSYVLGTEGTIETGKIYYFGQLWDGDGDGESYIMLKKNKSETQDGVLRSGKHQPRRRRTRSL